MAALAGGEEGSRAARLQSFFASVLSGLFGQADADQDEDQEMASRNHNAAAPQLHHHNRGPSGPRSLISFFLVVRIRLDWFWAEGVTVLLAGNSYPLESKRSLAPMVQKIGSLSSSSSSSS